MTTEIREALNNEEKPPSLCNPLTTGIHTDTHNGGTFGRKIMGALYRLSSPDLRFRFRNDLYLLALD